MSNNTRTRPFIAILACVGSFLLSSSLHAAPAPSAPGGAGGGGNAPAQPRLYPGGTEVRIVRGTETSVYQVPK